MTTTKTVSTFRQQAVEIVENADQGQVVEWAVRYWDDRLRAEERVRAREVEMNAQHAARPKPSSLPEGRVTRGSRSLQPSFGTKHEAEKKAASERAKHVWADRKKEQAEVAAIDVDLDTAQPDLVISKFPSQVHSLRIKMGSALHGSNPERWNALSREERHLFVRAFPAHPSIDREGPDWIDYLATPAGRIGLALVEASDNESLARTARRNALLNKIRFDTAVEWTKEILETDFALHDGTRVTWGAATAEQHQARIAMLYGHATASAEAAARHDAALQTLADFGASCLDAIPPACREGVTR